jgi:hypothetical protein
MWRHGRYVGTIVSEELAAFIINSEDAGKKFFWNADTYLPNFGLLHQLRRMCVMSLFGYNAVFYLPFQDLKIKRFICEVSMELM